MSFLKRDKPRSKSTVPSPLPSQSLATFGPPLTQLDVPPQLPLSPTSHQASDHDHLHDDVTSVNTATSNSSGHNNINSNTGNHLIHDLFNQKYAGPDTLFQQDLPLPLKKHHRSTDDSLLSSARFSPRSSLLIGGSHPHPEREREKSTSSDKSVSSDPNSLAATNSKEKERSASLKDTYRGFHASKPTVNIPPLAHPIKPRFKKKSSLLGKLIYANRKDDVPGSGSGSGLGPAGSGSTSGFNTSASSIASSAGVSSPNYPTGGQGSGQSGANELGVPPDRLRGQSLSLAASPAPSSASSVNGSLGGAGYSNGASSTRHASLIGSSSFNPRMSLATPARHSASLVSHKHKFRIPSILLFEHRHDDSNRLLRPQLRVDLASDFEMEASTTPTAINDVTTSSIALKDKPLSNTSSIFDLNLNEMHDIIKLAPSETKTALPEIKRVHKSVSVADNGVWKAPDSWDVNISQLKNLDASAASDDNESLECLLDCDETNSEVSTEDEEEAEEPVLRDHFKAKKDSVQSRKKKHHHHHHHNHAEFSPINSKYPVLFRTLPPIADSKENGTFKKTPTGLLRVFKEDNTFSTIRALLDVTAAELLTIVQKKFFLELVSNCQISVVTGLLVKVLEPSEKPMRIQTELLELLGYTEKEDIALFGREDLSFICKFILEDILLRQLTHEEELLLLKDYVDVNILGLNLKNIPIIFHQHTYEIERLDVGNNPLMYIPLDFIQLCNNLTSIVYLRNGASKFPLNLLAARKLTSLDIEKNFLNELPAKFGHLHNLTTLKLNSNQLQNLPRLFAKLKQLRVLNLSSNFFSKYPEEILQLTQLVELDLSYNDLLEIPELIGLLTQLAKLNLSTNKLETAIPEHFKELVLLKRLDIRYNKILNIDVLGSLPDLEVVYALKNNILDFSDRMDNLRLLHFDRNPITDLQFENTLPILTVLDLLRAKVTSVPPEFISRIPNIEKLVLDKNHLVTLPEELGNLPKLAVLSIYGNNLQLLPSSIGKLKLLQYLDVHMNNLQLLPEEIWRLKLLTLLNASLNILTTFPKMPQDLGLSLLIDSLLVLTLADNRFNDDIFELISGLTELKSLNLSYNDIVEIPEGACRQMTKLLDLYLSGNEMVLLPADDLEHLKLLRLLHINGNKFVTLPAELSKLAALQTLDVGSNLLKYNILNWPYDWNWHWNKALRYLNFLGNRRFEIKQLHIKNPETGEDFDSLLVLENLKVLGLIDVTLTTSLVPDQNHEMRIRTTASELDNLGYGVSDSMGLRECVLTRDLFMQKYRGNEDEVLVITIDGKLGSSTLGHRVLLAIKNLIVPLLTEELRLVEEEAAKANLKHEKARQSKIEEIDEDETKKEDVEPSVIEPNIKDALRRTYLNLNRDINGAMASIKATDTSTKPELELNLRNDSSAGASVTSIYIRKKMMYIANVGDIEVLLCHPNGEHTLLSTKHDPTTRLEFERIRASGGYVSADGLLDGELPISRGVGFFNFLPHTHLGPDVTTFDISGLSSGTIIIATKVVWDYILYELAVDIVRQEKDDPMKAAQKVRDYAIGYGANDKINVLVITMGSQQHRRGVVGNRGYMGRGRPSNVLSLNNEELVYSKRRPDRVLTGDLALMRLDEEIEPPIGELALVFTDIKSLTLLWDTYPVAMRLAIKIHNTIMRRQLRIVGGYEVKTEGDAFMCSFPSPSSALLWTFSVQQQLLTADWPKEILQTEQCCEITDAQQNIIFRGLLVRMGIHWGSPVYEMDVVTRRMDYFGPMVNRSARIQAVADGGQIAISLDFLHEMNGLFKIHELIKSGTSTIEELYQGNLAFGEITERELSQLEELGCTYYELGERKLKGLEVPELITLVYPKKLEIRYQIFQEQEGIDEENKLGPVVGALPIEVIYNFRLLLLRLESILNKFSIGSAPIQLFLKNSLNKLLETVKFKEQDLIALLNHITIRIEHYVGLFELRQSLLIAQGGDGKLDITEPVDVLDIVGQVQKLLLEVKKEKQ